MKKQVAKIVCFGLMTGMILSTGYVLAAETEIAAESTEKMPEDVKMVSLPGRFFQDEDGNPPDQVSLSRKDTKDCTYVLNADGTVSLRMTEETYNQSREAALTGLHSYWLGLFDKDNNFYREEYTDGLINESESAFAIIVDKKLYENTPNAGFVANMTMTNLTLLSAYAQAYNGVPAEEQHADVIFFTDDGEILLTNMGGKTPEEEPEETGIELVDGIQFGDTREIVLKKIAEGEGVQDMDTYYESQEEFTEPGYSCEVMTGLAFRVDVLGFPSSVFCVYKGDDGGLVDVSCSLAPKTEESTAMDVYEDLKAIMTGTCGVPVSDADVGHRSPVNGFAVKHLLGKSEDTSPVKEYSEWFSGDKTVKIELFYAELGSMNGESQSSSVWLDYRYQEE